MNRVQWELKEKEEPWDFTAGFVDPSAVSPKGKTKEESTDGILNRENTR